MRSHLHTTLACAIRLIFLKHISHQEGAIYIIREACLSKLKHSSLIKANHLVRFRRLTCVGQAYLYIVVCGPKKAQVSLAPFEANPFYRALNRYDDPQLLFSIL